MDFNGFQQKRNVEHLHFQILRINANIIKDWTLKPNNVKIIVTALLLITTEKVMFVLKSAAQSNVNAGKFLTTWQENAYPKATNVQELVNFTTLHQASVKFGVQITWYTIHKAKIVKFL